MVMQKRTNLCTRVELEYYCSAEKCAPDTIERNSATVGNLEAMAAIALFLPQHLTWLLATLRCNTESDSARSLLLPTLINHCSTRT